MKSKEEFFTAEDVISKITEITPDSGQMAADYFTAKDVISENYEITPVSQRTQRFLSFLFFPKIGKNKNIPALRELVLSFLRCLVIAFNGCYIPSKL